MSQPVCVLKSIALGLLVAAGTACSSVPETGAEEPLYFALEVRREGQVVAKPKLLGQSGQVVRAERRSPGKTTPDYRLMLHPSGLGEGFRVELTLALPGVEGRAEVALLHGQQRRVQLGRRAGELEVSLLLMRVNSPEFRTLMNLETEIGREGAPAAI